MALRERDKNRNKSTDAGVSMRNEGGEHLTKETKEKEPFPDVRSFRDQAIMVINILESQGIDLYDPTRTPGMYLKRRGTAKVPDALLKKMSLEGNENRSQTKNFSQPASVEKHNPSGEIPEGLLNFFSNNKK